MNVQKEYHAMFSLLDAKVREKMKANLSSHEADCFLYLISHGEMTLSNVYIFHRIANFAKSVGLDVRQSTKLLDEEVEESAVLFLEIV